MRVKSLVLVLLASIFIAPTAGYAQIQSFYPLQIGNRWDYSDTSWGLSGGGTRSTESVSIVADTVMRNGYRYVVFKGHEVAGGRFARRDSNWIYYYDRNGDTPFYNLNAIIGDKWNVSLGPYFFVTYLGTQRDSLFGVWITVKQYYLDGLAVAVVWLSDKFGPVAIWDQYDPPGIWNTYGILMGAVIADTIYGKIVSVDREPGFSYHYNLAQNFPNPFNSATNVRFTIPRPTLVSLKVFDILGREISTLASGMYLPGTYVRQWRADQNPTGIYFYRLWTSDFLETRKMLYLR